MITSLFARHHTDGGYGVHYLAKLELVEDGGLAGSVQPEHEDADCVLGVRGEWHDQIH